MPSDVRFSIVKKMFLSAGWTLSHVRGSRHVFTKAGNRAFPVPVHRNLVKYHYVRAIRKLLDPDSKPDS
jgi:predicted RNA binding protein YcfA (HicA-like mRNA interferase family)